MDISNLEKWSFGLDEKMANSLARLVLEGKKRATSSSLWGYEMEGEEIPKEGEKSVITLFDETPLCVVENKRVRIIPFKEITFALAVLEGEDENLESWQENHRAFFLEEGRVIGYTFCEDMPVVFEEFEVIEVL